MLRSSHANSFLSKGLACYIDYTLACYKPILYYAPNTFQQCLSKMWRQCANERRSICLLCAIILKVISDTGWFGEFLSFGKTQLKALDSQQVLVLVYITIQSRFLFLGWLFFQSYFKHSLQNMLPANFCCWQCKYQGWASIYISCTQFHFSPHCDWNYKSSSCIGSTALYLAEKFSEPTSCFSFNNFNNINLVKYANGSWKIETKMCSACVRTVALYASSTYLY